jgi:hypothetical protein
MIENAEQYTREELIAIIMEVLGIDEAEAEFILAMELGEIEGDIEVVED